MIYRYLFFFFSIFFFNSNPSNSGRTFQLYFVGEWSLAVEDELAC